MNRARFLALAFALVTAGPTSAAPQTSSAERSPITPPTRPAREARSVLLARDGNDAFATAPDWAAFFRAGEVRFAPASEPGTPGLALHVESVRRGGERVASPALGRPRVDGDRVVYAHPGFEEVYEARLEGLKQSFVFPTAPTGTGDLTVRLRLDLADADLAPRDVRSDGLTLECRGKSVLRMGAVLGLDAAGRETAGELRLTGDRLDLVLPASFVDSATYPLVLDPLITPFSPVPGTNVFDGRVDVAWDPSTRRFCLTWTRHYAGATASLAQLFEQDGEPVWPMAFLGWTFGTDLPPGVCAVGTDEHARFVTAHGERSHSPTRITVTSLRATDLKMDQFRYTVPSLTGLDIGGSHDSTSEACLVWSEDWKVRGQRFRSPGPDSELERLSPFEDSFELAGSLDEDLWSYPRISQSNGSGGSWLVVWQRSYNWQHYPEARTVGQSGLGATLLLASTGTSRKPTCDGDGEQFMVVHEEVNDIVGVLLTDSGSSLAVGHSAVLAESAAAPQVAITSNEDGQPTYAVAWSHFESPWSTMVLYRGFAAPDLSPSGPEQPLVNSARDLRIASLFGASPAVEAGASRLFALAVTLSFELFQAVATP